MPQTATAGAGVQDRCGCAAGAAPRSALSVTCTWSQSARAGDPLAVSKPRGHADALAAERPGARPALRRQLERRPARVAARSRSRGRTACRRALGSLPDRSCGASGGEVLTEPAMRSAWRSRLDRLPAPACGRCGCCQAYPDGSEWHVHRRSGVTMIAGGDRAGPVQAASPPTRDAAAEQYPPGMRGIDGPVAAHRRATRRASVPTFSGSYPLGALGADRGHTVFRLHAAGAAGTACRRCPRLIGGAHARMPDDPPTPDLTARMRGRAADAGRR